jgi:alkylhydroperoxidase family enzyme
MSRIPPAEGAELPQQPVASSSTMDLLFRTMAHRPELARQSMQLLETAMRTGTVEPKLKELLAVRVSQVNHCFY